MSDAAWEAEFRRSGKDRQFNSYIAFRRLDIALLNLWVEATRPLRQILCPHNARSWVTVQVTESLSRTTGGCTDCGKPLPSTCRECGR